MGGGEASQVENTVLAPQTRYTEDMELLRDTKHTATSTRNDGHCLSGDLSGPQMAPSATRSGRTPRTVASMNQKQETVRLFFKGEEELMDTYRKGVENRVLSSPCLSGDLSCSQMAPTAIRSGRRPRTVASNNQKRETVRFVFKGEQELIDTCRKGVENMVLSSPCSTQMPSSFTRSGRTPRTVASNNQQQETVRFFFKGEEELMDTYRKGVENRVLSPPCLSGGLSCPQMTPSATRSGRTPRTVASNNQKQETMKFFFKGEEELMDTYRKGVENRVLSSPCLSGDLSCTKMAPSATRSGRTPQTLASNSQKQDTVRLFFKGEEEFMDTYRKGIVSQSSNSSSSLKEARIGCVRQPRTKTTRVDLQQKWRINESGGRRQ